MNDDAFETSDAAYVLGALSVPERAAYEAHLQICPACAARVAELRGLPGLLSLAPESAFVGPPDDELDPVPDTLLPRLVQRTTQQRKRRRLLHAGAMAAAAACIVAFTFAFASLGERSPDEAPSQATVIPNVIDVPIEAKVELIGNDARAQVNVWCRYTAKSRSRGDYQAIALTRSGEKIVLGAWPGVPGETASMRTPTLERRSDIVRIEILGFEGRTLSRLDL